MHTMDQYIRITRSPYEEPHCTDLLLEVSNGRQRGQIGIYLDTTDLVAAADAIRAFPTAPGKSIEWELGSEDPSERSAYYLGLRLYAVNPTGRYAIEFRMNNLSEPPEREIVQFSIEIEPAGLDGLRSLLIRFSRLEHLVLEWRGDDGELRAS